MGYLWALISVLLVSVAQLALKQAMIRLPAIQQLTGFLPALLNNPYQALTLLAGLFCYLLSMLCWYLALRRLALSKAYSLLSLSYVLVWLAAGWLPGFHETYSVRGLLGLLAIIAGVFLIVSSRETR